jgi:hypothetical protein
MVIDTNLKGTACVYFSECFHCQYSWHEV